MTDERENRLRRLMEATGEKTKSGAIDVACKHYLSDLRAKERCIDKMNPDVVEELDNPFIPLTRDVTLSVGRNNDNDD